MPTTTTTPHPDIPLPDGTYALADWDETGDEYRMISTYAQLISESRVLVSATAVQLPDGAINVNDGAHDVPLIFLDELDDEGRSCDRLTISVEGARNLGRALLEAAAELDRWAAK